MTIRDATIADVSAVSSFVTEMAQRHIAPSLTVDGLTVLLGSMDIESTRQRISNGWLHIVDLSGGRLRGVIVVRPPTHLYHLFVDTQHQRSGIGRRLFDLADERTVRETRSPIRTVNASLNAIEIYRCLGFEISGPVVESDGVRFQPMTRIAH